MDGSGVYTWPDGRKYEGQYLKDKKHGEGKYTWEDGKFYKGSWLDGKQHGEGVYTTIDGLSRKGTWESGRRTKWIGEHFKSEEDPSEPNTTT